MVSVNESELQVGDFWSTHNEAWPVVVIKSVSGRTVNVISVDGRNRGGIGFFELPVSKSHRSSITLNEKLPSYTEIREKAGNNWQDSAKHFSDGMEFYRGIVHQIGELFGDEAKTSDDGSLQDTVLALKVPELVAAAMASHDKLVADHGKLRLRWDRLLEVEEKLKEKTRARANVTLVQELQREKALRNALFRVTTLRARMFEALHHVKSGNQDMVRDILTDTLLEP